MRTAFSLLMANSLRSWLLRTQLVEVREVARRATMEICQAV